jgi:hypothetical protein
MSRLVILIALVIIAVVIAALLQRRRPEPPSAPSYRAPSQLDRQEFAGAVGSSLVVVFASTACNSCPVVWEEVAALQRENVAMERIDVEDDPKRHERYRIDGVPTTLVADGDGVVRASFFGPLPDGALIEAVDSLSH